MRLLARLLVLVLLLAGAAGVAGYFAYQKARQPFRGFSEAEIFLTVPAGAPSAAIAKELESRGVISDRRLFLAALWLEGAMGRIQAGEYRFAERASMLAIIDRLRRGDVYYVSVTIPEGLTLFETADLLAVKGLGEAGAFREAFSRADLVASVDPKASDLEGYLFPDTYRFSRKPDAGEVARAMVSRFVKIFSSLRGEESDGEETADVRKLVTLASMIEKETGHIEERPLIASVFWNRLRRGMPLQSDPTIIYDLKRRGDYDGNLRRDDLKMDTPYNTYLFPGLPPGPIASPGRQALEAALYPADTPYLYFVSKNDGSHHFSATLREHAAAVRKYQVEFFRKRRRRKQEPGSS